MAGLPFSAGSCVLSMCGQFGVWSSQSLVCGIVIELCCTNSLLDLDLFRKVCFWFRCSREPAMQCKCTYLLTRRAEMNLMMHSGHCNHNLSINLTE